MTAVSKEAPDIQAADERRPMVARYEYALALGLLVAGAIVTWVRVPADHRDRVWAEDANIFLIQAIERGPWSVLFEGYAGYQHFVPRAVVALIFPFFDLAAYPVLIFAICSVLTGAVAAAVYWLARDLVPWLPARIGLAGITVLLPLATQETIGNLADIHTYAMWLTPWLLLYRPRRWSTSVGWAVVTLVAVLTEIQSVFFVFLLLFGFRKADRRKLPIFAAFLIASTAQLLTSVFVQRTTGEGPLSIPSTVMGWMINTVMPIVTGDPQTIRQWAIDSGMTAAVMILVPVAVATVVVLAFGTGEQRLLAATLLLGSAATYTGSAWANSGFWFDYAAEPLADLGIRLAINIRYGVASGMMLVAVVVIALAVLHKRWGRYLVVRALVWAACVAVLVVLAQGSTTAISIRNQVERWSPVVIAAAEGCATRDPDNTVTLPVAPNRSVDLTCAQVLSLQRR